MYGMWPTRISPSLSVSYLLCFLLSFCVLTADKCQSQWEQRFHFPLTRCSIRPVPLMALETTQSWKTLPSGAGSPSVYVFSLVVLRCWKASSLEAPVFQQHAALIWGGHWGFQKHSLRPNRRTVIFPNMLFAEQICKSCRPLNICLW